MFWLCQFTLSWTKNNTPGRCQMTPDYFRMSTKRKQKWWTNLRCGRTWGVGGYVKVDGGFKKTEHITQKKNDKRTKNDLQNIMVVLCIFDRLEENVVIFFCIFSGALTVNSTLYIYVYTPDVFLSMFTIHTFLSVT